MKTFLISVLLCVNLFAQSKPLESKETKVIITIGQLLQISQSNVLQKLGSQDYPALTSWRISRLITALNAEISLAVKSYEKLFTDKNSVAIKGGAPGARSLKPESVDAFNIEAKPLLEQKVELSIIPLSLENDLSSIKLSPYDIQLLTPLLSISKEQK